MQALNDITGIHLCLPFQWFCSINHNEFRVTLMGLETSTWPLKWNHSLAVVSIWYIINNSFFQHPIDIIPRTGRPISILVNAWIITVRGSCGDKQFLLKVTQLVNRLLFFQVMEIISENAKNIITKFHEN